MSNDNASSWHGLENEAAEYVLESIRNGDSSVVALDFLAWASIQDIADEDGRTHVLEALENAAARCSVPCAHCHGHGSSEMTYDGESYRAPCGDCSDMGEFRMEGPVVWSHGDLAGAEASGEDLAVAAE